MKYAYTAAALVSFVLAAPALADDCARACTDVKNACLGRPGSNKSTCAAEYAGCLGYNPYDKQPYVEPTACHKDTRPTHTHAHGDWCAKECIEKHNECLRRPGSNKSTCAAEFASCLGYNPYDKHPYVEPTACHKTPVRPTHTHTHGDWCAKECIKKKNECLARPGSNKSTCAAEFASCLGYNPYDKHPYVEPTACHETTVRPTHTHTHGDWCAKECVWKKDECLARPGSNKSTCIAEFVSCLGFNPYDKHPYVEPTACFEGHTKSTGIHTGVHTGGHTGGHTGIHTATVTGTNPPVVVVAGGDNLKPAMALLALGAAALL